MRIARAALVCALVVAVGVVLISGGHDGDPRTPAALPGLPPPFLGTAVSGDGGMTAAVDAYGDVVELRAPGPAGEALIDNPSARQAAGTVPEDTGIVPMVSIGGGEPMPMWLADSVTQSYVPGTNVVQTEAHFGEAVVVMTVAAWGQEIGIAIQTPNPEIGSDGGPRQVVASASIDVEAGLRCARHRRTGRLTIICRAGRGGLSVPRAAPLNESRWDSETKPLGAGAPVWARALYERSLLTIHALTSAKTGAVAAGARDGWAYVWPRDAATAALALVASGHRAEARKVAKFLTGLDLNAAARFTETGAPVPGRAAQGDAAGWVAAAAQATGVPAPSEQYAWRGRADYQESSPGTYLGNAIAGGGGAIATEFGTAAGLVRVAGDPGSGLDSAAGWAVRPFELHALYPAAGRTLLALLRQGTKYGITPGEGWEGGEDPWSAPTAWSAWALAGLGDRGASLTLLRDLRRAATPSADLPERVGAHTGIPTSTTPLLWSSAFAVLALRELWP